MPRAVMIGTVYISRFGFGELFRAVGYPWYNIGPHPASQREHGKQIMKRFNGLATGLATIILLFVGNASAEIVVRQGVRDAGTRLVLDYAQSRLRGRNQVIPLKRELKRDYPGVNFRHYDLVKVKLIAKSRRGHGRARLQVGGWQSPAYLIGGKPHRFHRTGPGSFKKIRLENGAGNSRGRWRVRLDGDIMLDRIMVKLRPKRAHVRRVRSVRGSVFQNQHISHHGGEHQFLQTPLSSFPANLIRAWSSR